MNLLPKSFARYIKSAFISASTSAVLLLSVPLTSHTASAHEIGLQLYSLRNQFKENVPGTFELIDKWGIDVVEGGGMLFDTPIMEFKQLLDKNNIELVSVDTNLEELRDNPIAVAYKAKFFGAKFATFYWIPHGEGRPFNIDDAKGAVEIMNKAGKVLSENGITLQYHPHGYEFLPHEDELLIDYIIKNTKNAEFQMDVYWVKQGGMDPVKLLRKYPGRFKSLHLKDRRKGSPDATDGRSDPETNVVLGEGDVGIKKVVAEAKKQGIRYFFIEDESSRAVLQIPESLKYLHKLDGRS